MEITDRNEKILGKGTFGKVTSIRFRKSDGEIINAARKEIYYNEPASGFSNTREIEILLRVQGKTLVPKVLLVSIGEYSYKPRNTNLKTEFISFICEEAKYDGPNFIARAKYSMSISIKLISEIFIVLDYLHNRGICHGDIKPGNCLIYIVNGVPTLKICDFGFANYLSGNSVRPRRINTAWYRAPEIQWMLPDYKFSSDVWSAGCTAYEFLTGKVLFDGVENGNDTSLYMNEVLKHNPNEWTIDAQRHYRSANCLDEKPSVHRSYEAILITPAETGFIRRLRMSSRYDHTLDRKWQNVDAMLRKCLTYEYWSRTGPYGILGEPLFDEHREYITSTLESQTSIRYNEVITINISEEITAHKVSFFTQALNILVPHNIHISVLFHAVDLANVFLTAYPKTTLNLDNVFGCCIYFFSKYYSITTYPFEPELFFLNTYADRNLTEEEIQELDRIIYDFESLVLNKHQLLGFKTFRNGLFEMQDNYPPSLTSDQVRIMFLEFCSIRLWDDKSYRAMYRHISDKCFGTNLNA